MLFSSSSLARALCLFGLAVGLAPPSASCAHPPTSKPSPTPAKRGASAPVVDCSAAAACLDTLMEQAFEERLDLDPSFAHTVGDPRHRDRLTLDGSEEFRRQVTLYLDRYLLALRQVDAQQLDPDRRIYRAAFEHWLRSLRRAMDHPDPLTPLLPGFGVPASFAQTAAGGGDLAFDSAADVRDFLGRSSDFAAWVDGAIVNLRKGLAQGVVHPRPVVEAAIRELAYHADAAPEKSVFRTPLRFLPTMPDTAPGERRSLAAAIESTAEQVSRPAYARLRDFLEREYLPRARDSLGMAHLPGGREWYRQRVAFFTTTELEPEEIFALGEKEVQRIRGQMRRWQRHLGGRTLHSWSKDADEVLDRFRQVERAVRPLLPSLFGRLPKARLEIRPLGAARAQAAAGAFYERPAPDGSRPGVFYVDLERGGFDLATAEVLFLHEALPGHHLQLALAQERADLPKFLRHGYFGAYVEGWGLYAESLGDELGLYGDPLQKLGALRYALGRAGRLIGDVGLHYRGWSRSEAESILRERGLYWAASELDRYATMPGQALAYTVGFVRLRQLRREAESRLGKRFDLRAFHDAVLAHGPLPLHVLEEKIGRWIEAQAERPGDGPID